MVVKFDLQSCSPYFWCSSEDTVVLCYPDPDRKDSLRCHPGPLFPNSIPKRSGMFFEPSGESFAEYWEPLFLVGTMQVLVDAILSEYRFTPNIWKSNQLSITFLSADCLNPSMSKHKQAPTQKRKRKNDHLSMYLARYVAFWCSFIQFCWCSPKGYPLAVRFINLLSFSSVSIHFCFAFFNNDVIGSVVLKLSFLV